MILFALLAVFNPPIGSDPKKWKDYEKAINDVKQTFRCLDGSKTIPLYKLNDDYKDCDDGSDEPGTSIIPGNIFYCKNDDGKQNVIYSWSVNDGICDCCDGSDEWNNTKVKCINRCKKTKLPIIDFVEKVFEKSKNENTNQNVEPVKIPKQEVAKVNEHKNEIDRIMIQDEKPDRNDQKNEPMQSESDSNDPVKGRKKTHSLLFDILISMWKI